MRKKGNMFTKFIVLFVLVTGLVAAFLTARRTLILSTKALVPEPTGNVEINIAEPENGKTKVELKFRTGAEENPEAVSVISFRLKVNSKSGKVVSMVDNTSTAGNVLANAVLPGDDIDNENGWKVVVNKSENTNTGFYTDFMVLNNDTKGYSSNSYKTLFSFYVTGAGGKDDLDVAIDRETNLMFSKRRPVTNIWVD